VRLPETAETQFLYLKQRGLLIPVEQGKRTPGALLFTFDHEPRPGDTSVPGAHVAISLGNGRTVEAANPRTDVGEFAAGNRFRYAAVLPGISDGSAAARPVVRPMTAPPTTVPAADPPVTAPAVDPPIEPPVAARPVAAPSVDPPVGPPVDLPLAPPPSPVAMPLPADYGGPDDDGDGLTTSYERRHGLDPMNVDTDGDNLSDAYELVTSHTDPRLPDTDRDGLADAFELARGLDPTSPDTNADGHLDGSFAVSYDDPDGDGLDSDLERVLGLNLQVADSDADGFVDSMEVRAGSDPMSARSTPLAHDPLNHPLNHPLTDPLHAGDGR
jgi:hypothetical protein